MICLITNDELSSGLIFFPGTRTPVARTRGVQRILPGIDRISDMRAVGHIQPKFKLQRHNIPRKCVIRSLFHQEKIIL